MIEIYETTGGTIVYYYCDNGIVEIKHLEPAWTHKQVTTGG